MDGLSKTDLDQLDAVVRLCRGVLGEAVIGAYLYGSAATSGLRRDSDLDVLVVSSRRMTAPERRALVDGLLPISRARNDPSDKRHLEVTFIARPDITPWHYPPPMELQYGDWWRSELESGEEPWSSPNPDLAVLLTAARAAGVSLFGPPITDLIEPVPRDDLRRAMRDVVPDILADLDGDVRNVLLTLARVWFTLETGTIAAKDVAADWALARLSEGRGDALRRARAGYLGDTEESWEGEALEVARADADAIRTSIEA